MGTKVIRGSDGRLLGLSYGDGDFIDRSSYGSWQDFVTDFSLLVAARLPRDTESEHAKRMIAKDDERLAELMKPVEV